MIDIFKIAEGIRGKLDTSQFPFQDKNGIVVLGNTGAGKSTLLNYLVGSKLAYKPRGDDDIDYVIDHEQNDQVKQAFMIGHKLASTTRDIQSYYSEKNNQAYYDTPGLNDTDKVQDIENLSMIKLLLDRQDSTKILIVIDQAETTVEKGYGVRKMLQVVDQLLNGVCNHVESIGLVITKGDISVSQSEKAVNSFYKKLSEGFSHARDLEYDNSSLIKFINVLFDNHRGNICIFPKPRDYEDQPIPPSFCPQLSDVISNLKWKKFEKVTAVPYGQSKKLILDKVSQINALLAPICQQFLEIATVSLTTLQSEISNYIIEGSVIKSFLESALACLAQIDQLKCDTLESDIRIIIIVIRICTESAIFKAKNNNQFKLDEFNQLREELLTLNMVCWLNREPFQYLIEFKNQGIQLLKNSVSAIVNEMDILNQLREKEQSEKIERKKIKEDIKIYFKQQKFKAITDGYLNNHNPYSYSVILKQLKNIKRELVYCADASDYPLAHDHLETLSKIEKHFPQYIIEKFCAFRIQITKRLTESLNNKIKQLFTTISQTPDLTKIQNSESFLEQLFLCNKHLGHIPISIDSHSQNIFSEWLKKQHPTYSNNKYHFSQKQFLTLNWFYNQKLKIGNESLTTFECLNDRLKIETKGNLVDRLRRQIKDDNVKSLEQFSDIIKVTSKDDYSRFSKASASFDYQERHNSSIQMFMLLIQILDSGDQITVSQAFNQQKIKEDHDIFVEWLDSHISYAIRPLRSECQSLCSKHGHLLCSICKSSQVQYCCRSYEYANKEQNKNFFFYIESKIQQIYLYFNNNLDNNLSKKFKSLSNYFQNQILEKYDQELLFSNALSLCMIQYRQRFIQCIHQWNIQIESDYSTEFYAKILNKIYEDVYLVRKCSQIQQIFTDNSKQNYCKDCAERFSAILFMLLSKQLSFIQKSDLWRQRLKVHQNEFINSFSTYLNKKLGSTKVNFTIIYYFVMGSFLSMVTDEHKKGTFQISENVIQSPNNNFKDEKIEVRLIRFSNVMLEECNIEEFQDLIVLFPLDLYNSDWEEIQIYYSGDQQNKAEKIERILNKWVKKITSDKAPEAKHFISLLSKKVPTQPKIQFTKASAYLSNTINISILK